MQTLALDLPRWLRDGPARGAARLCHRQSEHLQAPEGQSPREKLLRALQRPPGGRGAGAGRKLHPVAPLGGQLTSPVGRGRPALPKPRFRKRQERQKGLKARGSKGHNGLRSAFKAGSQCYRLFSDAKCDPWIFSACLLRCPEGGGLGSPGRQVWWAILQQLGGTEMLAGLHDVPSRRGSELPVDVMDTHHHSAPSETSDPHYVGGPHPIR